MSETLLFFKEFFANKQSIGGVKPSSKSLAKAMAKTVRNSSSPKKVLEIGAGTGIISEAILNNLGPLDSLTIVEINPSFAKLLKSKRAEWIKRENCPKIIILNIDFLNFVESDKFDVIIAGVPFNNFPVEIIEGFIKKIRSVSSAGAIFSYFEYIAARKVKDLFNRNERLSSFFEREVNPHLIREKNVLMNVPPAKINFICFSK